MKVSPYLLMMALSYLRIFPESNALLSFLFHGLFRDEQEIAKGLVNSQQRITVAHMRQLIEYFLRCGYTFASPDDILEGLDKNKRYCLITFDDGYYNNRLMVPLLEEYKIPALFFIATGNVNDNKSFWWDILYREAIKRNKPPVWVREEERLLKTKAPWEIEQYLVRQFGVKAFRPVCDVDRPFSPLELKDFSKCRYVYLGNHTSDHAILTNCKEEEARKQIVDCQRYLSELTGKTPSAISYPNGNYNAKIVALASELGLKIGFSVEPRKDYLPLGGQIKKLMSLGRFMLKGNKKFFRQMETARSDFSVRNKIKQLLRRNY